MQLTDDGFWIDPGTIDASIGIACGAMAQGTGPIYPVPPIDIQMENAPNPDAVPPTASPAPTSKSTQGTSGQLNLSEINASQPNSILAQATTDMPSPVQPAMEVSSESATPTFTPIVWEHTPSKDSPMDLLTTSDDLFLSPSQLSADPNSTVAGAGTPSTSAPRYLIQPPASNSAMGLSNRKILDRRSASEAVPNDGDSPDIMQASLNADGDPVPEYMFPPVRPHLRLQPTPPAHSQPRRQIHQLSAVRSIRIQSTWSHRQLGKHTGIHED